MQKYILWIAVLLTALATAALADWSRDIKYQTDEPATPHFQYLGIQGIHDGPVVADVVPMWTGKEILQATRDTIWILSADNQQAPMVLALPDPSTYLHVDCPGTGPDGNEFIAGQPAVGDVDNDGDNDIVVGVTYLCEDSLGNEEWLLDYYGSVVWWTWNGTGFDLPYSLRLEDAGVGNTFLGIPTICRTQWTNGDPTVVFWGPGSLQVTTEHHSAYALTAFDLSDPQQPRAIQADATHYATAAQLTWARGSGIYVQAADLNGDGYDELIAHSDTLVYRFDWSGISFGETVLYTVPDGYAFQSGYGAIADVNADGSLEYLVSYSGTASLQDSGRLVQINLGGTVDWLYGFNEPNAYPIVGTQPGVCDLSGYPGYTQNPPGRLSPITSTRHDSRMYNSLTGALRSAPAWPNPQLYYPNDQRNVGNPALAYVTGTPVQPQFIKVDIGFPNVGQNEIRVYDPITGDLMHSEDLDVDSLYLADPYSAVTSSPAYCDLDGNGQASIITSFRTGQNTLRIFRTDPGFAFKGELSQWSQIGNGPDHKGLYAQPVSGTQQPTHVVWSCRIFVYSTYTVPEGATLTIQPGTTIKVTPSARINIQGRIIAQGTEENPIVFVCSDPNQRWDQLRIYSDDPQNIADHVVVRHALFGVVSYDANLNLNHALIENCRDGLVYLDGTGSVQNTTIQNNERYGAWIVGSGIAFHDNVIANNGTAGLRIWRTPWVTLDNNTISDNGLSAGETSDAAGVQLINSAANLQCNEIRNNSGPGIIVYSQSHADMGDQAMNHLTDNVTNSIYQNWRGQITLSGGLAGLSCGLNTIGDVENVRWLIYSDYLNRRPGWNITHNYWGTTEKENIQSRINRNASTPNLEPLLTASISCYDPPPDPPEGILDPDELLFQTAWEQEHTAQFAAAQISYEALIDSFPKSEYAELALDRIEFVMEAQRISWADIRAYFQNLAKDSSQDTSLAILALCNAAWCLAEMEDYEGAYSELDSLLDKTDENYEQITIALERLFVELKENSYELLRAEHNNSGSGSPRTAGTLDEASQTFDTKLERINRRVDSLLAAFHGQHVSPPRTTVVIPKKFALYQNYPNPFNPNTEIKFDLPEAVSVKIRIFNSLGQEVTTLIDEVRPAGAYRVMWDSKNASGVQVASGVYVYQIQAGKFTDSKKMVLLR